MHDQSTMNDKIDSILAETVGARSPGLVLLVAGGDKILYRGARGMADVEADLPLDPGHRFIIGSVTKQVTGMAVMMMSSAGLLDIDGNVAGFFPGLPDYTGRVTIRHLLTHTAGIREYLTEEFWNLCSGGTQPSQDDVLELIRGLGDLEFEPGERWRYSNSGYVMLGSIIEQVSGMSFSELLGRNIFTPLGMRDSVVGTLPVMADRQATGYTYRAGDDFERAPYHTGTVGWADGNIISTVDDLLTWARALDSAALLPRRQLAEAYVPVRPHDPSFSRYGFGHVVGEWRGIRMIHHGGGTLGYASRLSRFPDAGLTVVILSNAAGIDLSLIEGAVVDTCLGHIMAPVTRVDVDPAVLASLAGTYSLQRGGGSQLVLRYDTGAGELTASGGRLLSPGETRLIPVAPGCLRFDDRRDAYLQADEGGLRLLMHGHVTGLMRVDGKQG